MNTITNAIRTECNEIYKSLHNIPYICKVVIGGSDLYIGEMNAMEKENMYMVIRISTWHGI